MRQHTLWAMMGLMVWAGVEFASPAATRASDWPGWRGPTGCGTTDERDLVLKDTVLVLLEQGGGGTLQAWDKGTGKVKWEQNRDKDKCAQCNTTPLLIDVQGKPQLVILASKILQSLNPADGEPLWWCNSARGFASSPLYSSGLIYADLGDDRSALAVAPTGEGDVTETHVTWKVPDVMGQWSSAVADGEYVYRVDESGELTCRKLATGEAVYTESLPDVSPLASPIATADGRIYFVSASKSYVIKAGPKFEVLGGGHVGGWDIGSSPAVSAGRIFVRDADFLYCIGKK